MITHNTIIGLIDVDNFVTFHTCTAWIAVQVKYAYGLWP